MTLDTVCPMKNAAGMSAMKVVRVSLAALAWVLAAISLAGLAHAQICDSSEVAFLQQPIYPDHAGPGAPSFTLMVRGASLGSLPYDFVNLYWNGVQLPFMGNGFNGNYAYATVDSSLLTPGTALVTARSILTSVSQPFYVAKPHNAIGPLYWTRQDIPTGNSTERQVVADINNDSIPDIISIDATNNAVVVYLGTGHGTFQSPMSFPTGTNPSNLAVGRFNSDDNLDVATVNYGDGVRPGTVSVLFGNGDGTLQLPEELVVGHGPVAIAAAGFSCSGSADDLAVVNSLDNTVSLFYNNSDGTFTAGPVLATPPNPAAIAIADLDGDGALDLAVANFGNFSGNTVSIWLKPGVAIGVRGDFTVDKGPQSIVAADLDGDGIIDLATANGCGHSTKCGRPGSVSILFGLGGGSYAPAININAGKYPFSIAAANLRASSFQDLVVTDLDGGTLAIVRQKTARVFLSPIKIPTNGRPVGLAVGDFNNDGKPDLVVGGTSPNAITLMIQK